MSILNKIFPFFLLLAFASKAQSGFIFPLKEKVFLTGNYGEIRPNHFHAGLDFKTHPEKNLPIYAVADGYVSRIKISDHGYGKALYITHANGLVSVYGHQYSYNDAIKKYVEAEQLKQETFEIELFPKPNELKVKQGDLIGYSGNTGDSEGAHLHFEIRDEKTEVPLNPLRFLTITDTVAPTITSVALYDDDYTVPRIIKPKKKTDTVFVSTKFGIGIECFDLEQSHGNKNNIYKVELFLDGGCYQRQILDSIPFDVARYVNTYCDYDIKRRTGIKIQKCFKGKNNDLPIYKNGHDGFLYLEDSLYHHIQIKVSDFYNNNAEVNVIVKRKYADKQKPIVNLPVNCLKPYKNSTDDYRIEIPEKSVYKDIAITDSFANGILFLYAKNYDVPLQRSCTLSIKVNNDFLKYADKLCIAEVLGVQKNYVGGDFENGFVKTTIKNFGKYKISIDTIVPKIKFVQPKNKKDYKVGDVIYFKVGDDFSGIGKFKLTINDVFQLAEYEHKTGMIFFEIRETTPKGKIKLKLILDDKKNNRATYETNLLIN